MKHLKPIKILLSVLFPVFTMAQVVPMSFMQKNAQFSTEIADNGLDFDGVDDYISIPNNTVVPLANSNYTLEAYIKPSTHVSNGIVGWGSFSSSNQTNAFRLGTGNTINNYWWQNDLAVPLPSSLADNKWHHVAVTFDGTSRKIYVSGVLIGSDTPTGHNVPSATNFRIGSTNNGEYFKGTIDDIRIWNVARTQAEIQENMNIELAGTETGLKAYYTFNQGIAGGNNAIITTVLDKTTNALNGTLSGFAKTGSTSNFVQGRSVRVLHLDAGNTASYSGSGTIWTDLSGNGNNATLVNGVTYDSANGGALVFDGTNNYATLANTNGFPFGSSAGTLSTWALTSTASAAFRFIISYGSPNANQSRFIGIEGSSYYFGGYGGGNDIVGTSVTANTWVNLVGVYDGVNASFYINGILVTGPIAKSWNTVASNAQIGRQTNGTEYWNGKIAQTSVYNRALTLQEIQQNFNATKSRYGL